MTAGGLLHCEARLDGRLAWVELGPPPGNIIELQLIRELRNLLAEIAGDMRLKGVVLTGAGKHFSFGASVAEHLPGQVEQMLPEFHELLVRIERLNLPPILAAVRGQCLGGGLELALACDEILVEPDAGLGCPEVKLGVIAPAASCLLPLRVGPARAATLLTTGKILEAPEAVAMGLAGLETHSGGLEEAAEAWVKDHYLSKSSTAVRQARKAARWLFRDTMVRILPRLEKQYLGELMRTPDAHEGLAAFMEKRKPQWEHE